MGRKHLRVYLSLLAFALAGIVSFQNCSQKPGLAIPTEQASTDSKLIGILDKPLVTNLAGNKTRVLATGYLYDQSNLAAKVSVKIFVRSKVTQKLSDCLSDTGKADKPHTTKPGSGFELVCVMTTLADEYTLELHSAKPGASKLLKFKSRDFTVYPSDFKPIGDLNLNGLIDDFEATQEIGSLLQAGENTLCANSDQGNLMSAWTYRWEFPRGTGQTLTATNGDLGYLCRPSGCVIQDKYLDATSSKQCCSPLVADSYGKCTSLSGALIGDNNFDGDIDYDPGNPEIGSLSQGNRCAAGLTLWEYNYADPQARSYRASNSTDGYVCRPSDCIPAGGYKSLSKPQTCCSSLTLNEAAQRCESVDNGAVIGDDDGNRFINGAEIGSLEQRYIEGRHRCETGFYPWSHDPKKPTTDASRIFKVSSTGEPGYICKTSPCVDLGEYLYGYRDMRIPCCGTHIAGANETCVRKPSGRVGDIDNNDCIDLYETSRELGELAYPKCCVDPQTQKEYFKWTYNVTNGQVFKTDAGKNGYVCRSVSCVSAGEKKVDSTYSCCTGLIEQSGYCQSPMGGVGGGNTCTPENQYKYNYNYAECCSGYDRGDGFCSNNYY